MDVYSEMFIPICEAIQNSIPYLSSLFCTFLWWITKAGCIGFLLVFYSESLCFVKGNKVFFSSYFSSVYFVNKILNNQNFIFNSYVYF